MTRVTSIDAGGVVVSGLLNLRRFEQRPGEVLVVGELLDSPVTLVEDGESGDPARRRHGATAHPRLGGRQGLRPAQGQTAPTPW